MKKLLFTLVLLFSLISYSQEYKVLRVNDTICKNGYVSVSTDFPKVVVIKTDNQTLKFEDVVPGDEMDDYYTLYSNDDNFRFDFYQCKVVFYTKNKDEYNKQYTIDIINK